MHSDGTWVPVEKFHKSGYVCRIPGSASQMLSHKDFTGPSSDVLKTGNDLFNACFTCDAMGRDATSLLANCQATGKLKTCRQDSLCLIEVRRRNGNFMGMRTSCSGKSTKFGELFFGEDFVFGQNFDSGQDLDFGQNFDFWSRFRFLVKISIFGQSFYFCYKL